MSNYSTNLEDLERKFNEISKRGKPQWVLAKSENKRPIQVEWQKKYPTSDEALNHIRRGGVVGIVPKSIGALVVDADFDEDEQTHIVTRKDIEDIGISHLQFYRCKSKSKNSQHWWFDCAIEPEFSKINSWKYGDILHDRCFVILWQLDAALDAILAKFNNSHLSNPIKKKPVIPSHLQKKGIAQKGGRNNTLYAETLRAGVHRSKEDRLLAEEKARAAGLPESEILATSLSGWSSGKKKPKRRKIDPDKVIQKNADGLKKALDALNIKVRDCILTKSYQIKFGDGKWEKFSDKNVDYTLNMIGDKFHTKNEGDNRHRRANFADTEFKRAINALLYAKEVNSLCVDYLDMLPEWEEETMVSSERLFIDALGADDTELNRQMGRMLIQAIVERAYCTKLQGVKFDYLPILIGTLEGEGKSSFCEYILPFPMLYLNTFDISAKTQEQQESIMGKVVVEMAELVGADKPQTETKLKNLLSISTEPQVRHAYKRYPIEYHRVCVFIGTTNDETPIKLTGSRNRRMVPIRVKNYGRQHVVGWLMKHRDAIFAHAKHCMVQKMPLYFQGEVEQEQVEAVYAATSQDTDTIDNIMEWHDERKELQGLYEFSMDEVVAYLYRLDIANDRKEITSLRYRRQRDIGKLLKNHNYQKARFIRDGESKQRVYYYDADHPSEQKT